MKKEINLKEMVDNVIEESKNPNCTQGVLAKINNKGNTTQIGYCCDTKKDQILVKHGSVFKVIDYDDILFIDDNRNVKISKLKTMVMEMSKVGIVPPIFVIESSKFPGKYYIIDGQHRAICCAILGYDIPYVSYKENEVKENITISELLQALNTNQKNWTSSDYVNNRLKRDNHHPIWDLYTEFEFKFESGVTKNSKVYVLSNGNFRTFDSLNMVDDKEIYRILGLYTDTETKRIRKNIVKFNTQVKAIKHKVNTDGDAFIIDAFVNLLNAEGLIYFDNKFIKYLENHKVDHIPIKSKTKGIITGKSMKTSGWHKRYFAPMYERYLKEKG